MAAGLLHALCQTGQDLAGQEQGCTLPSGISTWWPLVPAAPHGLSPTPRWLAQSSGHPISSMQPLARSTQQAHQPNHLLQTDISTEPRNQGKPRLLIHGRRLLRTNERREGNWFPLGWRGQDCPSRITLASISCIGTADIFGGIAQFPLPYILHDSPYPARG